MHNCQGYYIFKRKILCLTNYAYAYIIKHVRTRTHKENACLPALRAGRQIRRERPGPALLPRPEGGVTKTLRNAKTAKNKPANFRKKLVGLHEVGEGGFEPPKALPADLQSVPFDHSGIPPYSVWLLPPARRKRERRAGGRTRTPDLLITNQLLYQLSYTSRYQRRLS